jgi:organic radical activating enzyme
MSDTFCPLLYAGIATDPSGGYRPCCRFDWSESFSGPLEEYTNSDMFKKMERQFLNGEWPKGCSDCAKEEPRTGQSKRIREIANYKRKYKQDIDIEHLKTNKYDLIDLRLSNKCNLGCLTCNPRSSSLIYDEVKQNEGKHLSHMNNVYTYIQGRDLTNPYSDSEIDKLFDLVSKSARIYFTGGEPSIVKGCLRFLQRLIDEGYNETVTLEFNSNFQTSNPKFIYLLSHFPKGLMMPSIDAIGIRAEYIRYPSNWERIESNIKLFKEKCPTWKIHFAPTISILNLFYLDELLEYCLENNYECKFNNILHAPKYFNICNLPNNWKDKAAEKIAEMPDLVTRYSDTHKSKTWLSNITKYMYGQDADYDRLKALKVNLEKNDKIRNTNYKESLPILEEIFKECL